MGFQRQETEQRAGRKQQSSRRVRQIREQQDSSDSDSDEFCNQTFVLGNRSKDSYKIDVSVNSAKLTMEVDCTSDFQWTMHSAAVSIMFSSTASLFIGTTRFITRSTSIRTPASLTSRLKTIHLTAQRLIGVRSSGDYRESLLLSAC